MRRSSSRGLPAYLRLISDRSTASGTPAVFGHGREAQLAFPYPEEGTIFLVYVPTMKPEDFDEVLAECLPRWIFDVRAVPRLDLVASSRQSAFSKFQKARVNYVDFFGHLGIRSYRSAESNPAIWGGAMTRLLIEAQAKGPFLILFDDENLFRAAETLLPSVLDEAAFGKGFRFAPISTP